VKKAF